MFPFSGFGGKVTAFPPFLQTFQPCFFADGRFSCLFGLFLHQPNGIACALWRSEKRDFFPPFCRKKVEKAKKLARKCWRFREK